MKIIATTANGVESTFTEEQWKKAQANPMFKNTFTAVKKIEEPREVTEAKARVAAPSGINAPADKKLQEKLQDKQK